MGLTSSKARRRSTPARPVAEPASLRAETRSEKNDETNTQTSPHLHCDAVNKKKHSREMKLGMKPKAATAILGSTRLQHENKGYIRKADAAIDKYKFNHTPVQNQDVSMRTGHKPKIRKSRTRNRRAKKHMHGTAAIHIVPFFAPRGRKRALRVLILNETDFSLSCAVAKLLDRGSHVLATAPYRDSFLSENARNNCRALTHMRRKTSQLFGIDVTKLHRNSYDLRLALIAMVSKCTVSDVIFPWPRNVTSGADMDIAKAAKLITETFQSIEKANILDENGTVHLFVHVGEGCNDVFRSFGLRRLKGWRCVYSRELLTLEKLKKMFPDYVPTTFDARQWTPQHIRIYSFRRVEKKRQKVKKKQKVPQDLFALKKKEEWRQIQEQFARPIERNVGRKETSDGQTHINTFESVSESSEHEDMSHSSMDLDSAINIKQCQPISSGSIDTDGVQMNERMRALVGDRLQQLLQEALENGSRSSSEAGDVYITHESFEFVLNSTLTKLIAITTICGKEEEKVSESFKDCFAPAKQQWSRRDQSRTKSVNVKKPESVAVGKKVEKFYYKSLKSGVRRTDKYGRIKIRCNSAEIIFDQNRRSLLSVSRSIDKKNKHVDVSHAKIGKSVRKSKVNLPSLVEAALTHGKVRTAKHGKKQILFGHWKLVFDKKKTRLISVSQKTW